MYYSTILLCGWIVLFCADIWAVNYTDMHDVDEDRTTVSVYGGYWVYGDAVGVTCRRTTDPLNIIYANVASMCRHL